MEQHSPTVNLISAVALDGSIGAEGKLLWKIKQDLAYYKSRTWDNVIIMGETTYETLPKVALRGRTTVVVSEKYTEKLPFAPNDEENDLVVFVKNPNQAINMAKLIAIKKDCDIYVAGGASIYEQLLPECDYAFITWVDKDYKSIADKFFPLEDFHIAFECISESEWSNQSKDDVGEDQLDEPNYKFAVYKNTIK